MLLSKQGEIIMLRGMVFVDHMNFNIAMQDYYSYLGKAIPKLDFYTMYEDIAHLVTDVSYVKTLIFAPKPDDFLMQDKRLANSYKWVQGMANVRYIDVVEGQYVARPTEDNTIATMNIADHSTYYKIEKGTDINLTIHALSKAYTNAYDVAIIVSGDTDYVNLYRQLKSIGKLVVVVAVSGQNLSKIVPEVDDYKYLGESFFDRCTRTNV